MIAALLGCNGPDATKERPVPESTAPHPTTDTSPVPVEYPAPSGIFSDCPRLVYAWQVQEGGSGWVHDLLPAPDGDLYVGGDAALQTSLGPGAGDAFFAPGIPSGFAARLDGEGHVKWVHSVGVRGSHGLRLAPDDGVWLAGDYDDVPITIDGVAVPGASPTAVPYSNAYGVKFDRNGRFRHLLQMDTEVWQNGYSAGEDSEGNLYLVGSVKEGQLHFGGWTIPEPMDAQNYYHGFVASWSASGTPRWATVLVGQEIEEAVFSGDSTSIALFSDDPERVLTTSGVESVQGPGLITLDLETGAAVATAPLFDTFTELWNVTDRPGASPILTGYAVTPAKWTDSDGGEHTLENHDRDIPAVEGFAVTLDSSFRIAKLVPGRSIVAATVGDRPTVVGGQLEGDRPQTFARGTEREFTMRHPGNAPRDSVALLLDDAGVPKCGWSMRSDEAYLGWSDVSAVTWTTDGALWIGGRFRYSMKIRDQQDQVLVDWYADLGDGFLLRFELPDP